MFHSPFRIFLSTTFLSVLAFATTAITAVRAGDDRLVVHEWGTFTCLQDDDGRELHGINIDDEPVPKFVHNLAPFVLSHEILSSTHWEYKQKAVPRSHPLVTMRLETPVIYFHPPKNQLLPFKIDVDVKFRGGWLTEFYPEAKADMPGVQNGGFRFSKLTPDTISRLTWSDVLVGTNQPGPETDAHVWLAPRKVEAAGVTLPNGESERYLFYRGVGHQKAPLRVERGESQRNHLLIHNNFGDILASGQKATMPAMWLVEAGGKVGGKETRNETRYRKLPGVDITKSSDLIAETNLNSGEWKTGLDNLKKDMHAALVADGLFADEATAMLSTWNRAYFQTEGLRLFFLVPRVWTDH